MKRIGLKILFALVIAAALLPAYVQAQPTLATRIGGYQLILDAGHGGEDGGAVSCTGVPESQINLEIVLKLDQLLGFCGQPAILLRDEDISLHSSSAATLREKKRSDLKNRAEAIEAVNNAALISIHQNTFPKAGLHGAQVFYRPGEGSQTLAQSLQTALQHADPENRRTPAAIPDSVYLMKHISCPAALVECGFLSNPQEEAKLRSDAYQSCLSVCILGGWLDFIQNGGDEHVFSVV